MFNPDHMTAGVRKALASPKTPAHLKPHLAKRLNDMSGIHINPANKGKFTAKAKAADKSVQQYAAQEAHAGGVLGKEANFARMAERHFKPLAKKTAKKKSNAADAFMGR
jgi:hypothetical protein